MAERAKYVDEYYAVDLQTCLAINESSTPALFYRRKKAVEFKRALAEHGLKGGKVIKVRVTLEVIDG